tara:strand:+ start:279 stop:1283 length:1005 start_codon:yes stop_codon:yes gene_type:complete
MNRLKLKNRFDGSLIYGARDFQEKTGRLRGNTNAPFGQRIFEKYGDNKTGFIKKEFLEYRHCLCLKDKSVELFTKHGLTYHLCAECDYIYVNPILREKILMEFYFKEETWYNVLQNDIQQEMDELKFSYGLDLIENHINNGSLLDVGSGTGHFISIASKRGWECLGIEFNKKVVEDSIKNELQVVDEELGSNFFDNKEFKLITMWEVLEHLKDPRLIVQRCNQLLSPNGLLFILVPNTDSLLNRILHEKSGSFTPHCHISMFNPRSLKNLLMEENFDILECETLMSELNNIKNHLSYQSAYSGETLKDFDFLTPQFLHDNLLGCKLLMIARKVL